MTLYELVNKLKDIAREKPNINFVGEGDVYELNHLPNIDYSVFYITQDTHQVSENTAQYTLNLFYIDRLTDTENNRLIVQSNGIDAITNIVNELVFTEDVDIEYPLSFTPFYQRFADDCTGVFCTITFNTNNNLGVCSYE